LSKLVFIRKNFMKLIKDNNNTKGFVGLVVLLVVVLLVLAGVMYATRSGLLKLNSKDATVNNNIVVPEQDKVYKVDFAYTVKSITPEQIVLNGQNGDFTLPNDPSIVTVYKGPTKESPKMELSQLKVGDTLNMEFIPGKSATLFVTLL